MRIMGFIALIGSAGAPATVTAQVDMGQAMMPTRVQGSPHQPLALGSGSEHDARIGANLRLRVATVTTAPGPRGRSHQRLAGSMVDLYPIGGSGFHLSAGTRLYDPRPGDGATGRRLVGAPREINIPGGRAGLRRTPALTMGYNGALADHMSIGVEVGAMKGRAYANATDATRQLRGERGEGNPVNPMVHLTLGRRF